MVRCGLEGTQKGATTIIAGFDLVSVGREKDLFAFTCDNVLEDTKQTKGENTTTPDR